MSIYVGEVRPNVGAPPFTEAAPSGDAPDYSKMTKEQLRGLADERGIAVPKSANKADIIALLEG
jgi:hypothetical protein